MIDIAKDINVLGTSKISRLLAKFAIPGIISMTVSALYNIVDQIFIGQGVGYLGNGATNVILPITILIISLSLLLGDGSAAYLSLKLGEKDAKDAAKGIGSAFTALMIISIALMIVLLIGLEPVSRVLGATDMILPYAMDYGRIIVIGIPFVAIDVAMASMIRADGSPNYSMAGLLMGCITNIILDPIFIFVFKWGVAGAAFATIIGQILNAVFYLFYFKKMKNIDLKAESFKISGKILKRISELGISSFITQFSIVVVIVISNNLLVSYGAKSIYGAEIPLATIGVTMKVNQIMMAIITGLAGGAQPIFGYNYGSGQILRVKQTFKLTLSIAFAVLISGFLVFQITPMSVVSIFGSESELYNEFAVMCLKIFLMLMPLNALQMVSGVFFQAIGKPVQASVLSLSRQVIFLIPAMILLPMALGVVGVLWAGVVADAAAFVVALIMIKVYWNKL